ncbi:hypothetical protein LPJ73_003522 [Coemansia sp. RSA 2703]|nr:hypothetical protein LPJ73_003522 [Coemansia sp. RSA 2703]
MAQTQQQTSDTRRNIRRQQLHGIGIGRRVVRIIKAMVALALACGILSFLFNIFTLKQPMQTLKHIVRPAEEAARAGVVVVGGGLAGLAAALEALQQTQGSAVRVVMVEKEARTGGNSAKASSGINGAWTQTQQAQGIKDSAEAFERDTLRSGKGLSNGTLARRLARESAEAVAWLQTRFALDLDVVAQLGGHSAPRTHRRPDTPDGRAQPVGWGIVSALAAQLAEQPRFTLLTGARVVELLQTPQASGSAVSGVVYATADGQHHRLQASAVVLATGGFGGADTQGLMHEHAPQLASLPTTNGAFATGDGVKLGVGVGAALVDMQHVQVHPTGFVSADDPAARTKVLAAEALRGAGGLLLTARGQRFVDELATRDVVTAAITQACSTADSRATYPGTSPDGAAAFLVLSQAAADAFGHGALAFYVKMHLLHRASDVSELASALRVPQAALDTTLRAYDQVRASNGALQDAFGKRVFPQAAVNQAGGRAAYYWGVVAPCVHYTMGGLRFDERARVLRAADGSPVPGLFAAGEVTGGLHGANRLAGNSLLECVVFGREAGRQAARAAM